MTNICGKTVDGVFHDDWLCEGSFDKYGTGRGRMASMDTVKSGDFVCGCLVQGRAEYPNGQVHEGSFVAETLIKGSITFESGYVDVIE